MRNGRKARVSQCPVPEALVLVAILPNPLFARDSLNWASMFITERNLTGSAEKTVP